MTQAIPDEFDNVNVVTKANVYFNGKVVSYSVLFAGGSRKTLGIIYPGTYKFDTGAPERMDITSGTCTVKPAGESEWTRYSDGSFFQIPGNSSYEIAVDKGLVQYVCSYGEEAEK